MSDNHRISIEPEHRSQAGTVYSFRCSCGAYEYAYKSKGAAEHAGSQHQEKKTAGR